MKKILFILTVIALAISCQQAEKGFSKEEEENQEMSRKAAEEVHDEMMGAWSKLKNLVDSLQTLAPKYEEEKEIANALQKAKKAAEAGVGAMNDWMKNYNRNKASEEGITQDEIIIYFEEQKTKADAMKITMENGLKMAEDFLNKYEAKDEQSSN